jgi:hypothetical protein
MVPNFNSFLNILFIIITTFIVYIVFTFLKELYGLFKNIYFDIVLVIKTYFICTITPKN